MDKKLIKKVVSFLVILMILSLFTTGCGGQKVATSDSQKTDSEKADNEKVYEVKMCHLTSTGDPIHLGFMKFKELVEAKSQGRIKVTIFPNKQISNSDREQAEKVQQNIIQMTSTPTFTLAGLAGIDQYQIIDYPYLFKNDEDIYKVMDGPIGEELAKKLLDKTGIRAYKTYSLGWVKIGTTKKPINTPQDLKGLKIRTTNSNLYMDTMKACGASPTPVAYGEVYTALQQGTVDGMITTTGLFVSDRFYEVIKYMADINPFSITHVIIVNNDFYQSLPDDLKKVFDECMDEYTAYVRQLEAQYEKDSIKALRDKGVQFTELTPEQKKLFIDLCSPIIDANADLVGKEFLDKVKAALAQ
jgi:tripartite ATP-independent transporter DctP family solute receptor